MKMVKSLILGSAAGLVVLGGAQAADLPVKAKAVEYVKICSLYGAGFYYIPGTDTCIKLSGTSNPKIEQGSSNLSWSRMTQMPEGNGKVVQQQDRTPQKELKLDKLSDMIPSSTATVKVCVEKFLLCTCLCAVLKASLTVMLFCHL
jgi:hypothetical protein